MSSTASTPSLRRPSLALLGSEPWRAAFELAKHTVSGVRSAPRGDGHPVILFPGLGSDGLALIPLRNYCNSLGYQAFDWGRGRNTGPEGDVDAWLDELAAHTMEQLAPFKQKATLIGWSLGGLYARELAKLIRPRVRQVITMGTPFNWSNDATHVGWILRLLRGDAAVIDAERGARLRKPPSVPTTSLYSRDDGIVSWQACQHPRARRKLEDVEVEGSHLGMGWNRSVMRIVADRLAQPAGDWRPLRAA